MNNKELFNSLLDSERINEEPVATLKHSLTMDEANKILKKHYHGSGNR